jgi:hypothetical protein
MLYAPSHALRLREVAAVAMYVRNSWGHAAPALTIGQVQLRGATPRRKKRLSTYPHYRFDP